MLLAEKSYNYYVQSINRGLVFYKDLNIYSYKTDNDMSSSKIRLTSGRDKLTRGIIHQSCWHTNHSIDSMQIYSGSLYSAGFRCGVYF